MFPPRSITQALMIFLAMTWVVSAAEQSPPAPLDLQACFELAVLQSETLGLAREEIEKAQAQYLEALGGMLPRISVGAEQRWQDPSESRGNNGNTRRSGERDTFEATVSLRQTLFSGFRDFHTLAARSAGKQAVAGDLARARQLLYLDTADLFYQLSAAESSLRLLDEERQALLSRVEEIERRIALGRSRSGDRLLARADLAEVLVSFEQTQGVVSATRELLAFLTGRPAAEIRIQDSTPFPQPDRLERYVQNALSRPDIRAALERTRQSERDLSARKGEFLPTVNLDAGFTPASAPRADNDWNIALTMEIPLFEGGITRARVKEGKALVRQAEINLQLAERTAKTEVRTAYNDFLAKSMEVVRLQELAAVSGQNLEVQRRDYERGIASNLDVLTALRQYHRARRGLAMAEAAARNTLVRLAVASGETP